MLAAQTGQGKTYWVSHGLYDYLQDHGLNCLYLIQRVRTKEQQQFINFAGKENTITVQTYQGIEQKLLRNKSIGHDDFIICDEAHYFTNDVSFNHNTDIGLDWIMQQDSIKVFMSATLDSFKHRLLNSMGTAFLVHMPLQDKQDYTHIDNLTFYSGDNQLEQLAAEVIQKGNKAVFFIQSAKKAYELYKKFEETAIFSCSKTNTTYKQYMNESTVSSIIENSIFNKPLLITTAALDSGLTLRDKALKTIVVDILEPETVIQCVGRKRPVDAEDHIDLYIRGRSNAEINRSLQQMIAEIKSMQLFLEDEQEYYIKYGRQNSSNHLVYDKVTGYDNNNDPIYKKSINMSKTARLEYYAYNLFPSLTKASVPLGYNKHLAKHFGFFDEKTKHYTYQNRTDKQQSLRTYLDSVIGIEFLTVADRKPLIEALHVMNKNRKLLRTIDPLNGALQEMGFPHRIMTYRRNPYKCIWKVVDPTKV